MDKQKAIASVLHASDRAHCQTAFPCRKIFLQGSNLGSHSLDEVFHFLHFCLQSVRSSRGGCSLNLVLADVQVSASHLTRVHTVAAHTHIACVSSTFVAQDAVGTLIVARECCRPAVLLAEDSEHHAEHQEAAEARGRHQQTMDVHVRLKDSNPEYLPHNPIF